jgi:hypothetical protein
MGRAVGVKAERGGKIRESSWADCGAAIKWLGASAIPGSRTDAPAHDLQGRGRRGLRAVRGRSEADKVRRPSVRKETRGAARLPRTGRVGEADRSRSRS